MMESSIRVYELAWELGVLAQAVLEAARQLGYAVRNQVSTRESDQRAAVEKLLRREPPEGPTGVPSSLRPQGPGSSGRQGRS
jgi:hypothetical protein